MAARRFLGRREALRGSQSVQKTGNNPANVQMTAKASLTVVVRRFQGVYECGCQAPPIGDPENCPKHNAPRKYVEEMVGDFDAEARRQG